MLTSYKQINQDLIAEGLTPNNLSQISESYWSEEFDGKIELEAVSFQNGEYYLG